MSWTITWVLRYAPELFLLGLGAIVLSLSMLFVVAPTFADDVPFVPAVWAFGDVPWYGLLALGVGLILRAWLLGAEAKRRAGY